MRGLGPAGELQPVERVQQLHRLRRPVEAEPRQHRQPIALQRRQRFVRGRAPRLPAAPAEPRRPGPRASVKPSLRIPLAAARPSNAQLGVVRIERDRPSPHPRIVAELIDERFVVETGQAEGYAFGADEVRSAMKIDYRKP